MDGSLNSRLPAGEFPTDGPETSSGWPWVDDRNDSVDPLGYEAYVASAVYLTLTGLVAIVGNVTAIIVFMTEKEFRKKEHNSLLLNMAIADVSVSIFVYPSSTAAGFAGEWLLGDVGCTIQGFLSFMFSIVTMTTLVAISVYRYIVICKPQYGHLLTHHKTVYVIIGIWLYALLFTTLPLVGVNRYTYEPIRIICSLDWNVQYPGETVYIALCIVFGYVVNVLIMGFCYINVLCKSTNLKFAALASATAKKAVKKNIRKASWMCMAMVTSFLIAWTPYAVSAAWTLLSEDELPLMATVLPSMFAKLSCMMNPIIYACCNSSYRQAALKSFRRIGCFATHAAPLDAAPVVSRKRRSTTASPESMAMQVIPPGTVTGDEQPSA